MLANTYVFLFFTTNYNIYIYGNQFYLNLNNLLEIDFHIKVGDRDEDSKRKTGSIGNRNYVICK